MLVIEILSLLSIYAFVGVFQYVIHKTPNTAKHNKVTLHPAFGIAGAVGSLGFGIAAIVTYAIDETELSITFFVMSLLFSTLILGYFGYRVTYDEEIITYRLFFEKPKTIHYNDIVDLQMGMDLKIETYDRLIRVPNYTVNQEKMFAYVKTYVNKGVKKRAKAVPKVRKYTESVERPGEFIAIFFIIMVAIGAFGIIAFFCEPGTKTFLIISSFIGAWALYIWLSVHSAKRAHSSEFWKKVAYFCYKPGYLVDDARVLAQNAPETKNEEKDDY